jgi:polyisoprenyl-phosphate glycosyltransferase
MPEELFSVIVPLFNEEEVIEESYKRLKKVLEGIDGNYELILVNDGSKDKTVEMAKAICARDSKTKLISFSRNFGHQTAITAGMELSSGDAVIVIDADLQDPPEVIPQLITKYREGFDVVYGLREKRKGETFFKKFTAKMFYRLLRRMTDIDIPVDTGDFRLISRAVCDAMLRMKERNRFVRGLVSWVGFKQTGVKYVREERFAGTTKYPLKKMIKFSVDGITSFSTKPLKFATNIGFLFSIAAFVYLFYIILAKIIANTNQPGWTSTVVLVLFIGGIQLIMLGIIGEYIARIFDESKGRPLYIVKELVNFNNKKS